jgi:hypothetical protein
VAQGATRDAGDQVDARHSAGGEPPGIDGRQRLGVATRRDEVQVPVVIHGRSSRQVARLIGPFDGTPVLEGIDTDSGGELESGNTWRNVRSIEEEVLTILGDEGLHGAARVTANRHHLRIGEGVVGTRWLGLADGSRGGHATR